jgi:hypothetical protein
MTEQNPAAADPTAGFYSSGPLKDEEVRQVVDELEAAYSRSQQAYDASIRTIAAGAVAVTGSLVAALEVAGWSGSLAVAFSVAALGFNLLSYGTAQRDTRTRIARAIERDRVGVFESRWMKLTTFLNAGAGVLVMASGCALGVFLLSHT